MAKRTSKKPTATRRVSKKPSRGDPGWPTNLSVESELIMITKRDVGMRAGPAALGGRARTIEQMDHSFAGRWRFLLFL